MARKFLAEEDFTFDDFLQQMAAIKKMGSLKSMLKMMPGMQGMRDQLDALDEREFDRVEAMVRSMTPYERTHPKQIDGSRRARIARGSGVTVSEVNQLLERFREAQKMMKSLARGGGGGMPGMPGIPGTARRAVASRPPSGASPRAATRPSVPPRRRRRWRSLRRRGRPRLAARSGSLRALGLPTPTRQLLASTRRTCRRGSRSSSAADAGSPLRDCHVVTAMS